MSPPRTPKDITPEKPAVPVETDQEATQPERSFAADLSPDTTHPSDKNNRMKTS